MYFLASSSVRSSYVLFIRLLVIVAFGASTLSCDDEPKPVAPSDPVGIWMLDEVETESTCGSVGEGHSYRIEIVRDHDQLEVTIDGVFSMLPLIGTLRGDHLSWTGKFSQPSRGGWVTITALDVLLKGDRFSGTMEWSIQDSQQITVICRGKSSLTGTRLPKPPAAPDQLQGSALSPTSVRLTWRDNSRVESGFQIQRKSTQSPFFFDHVEAGRNATSFVDTNVSAGWSTDYRVRAFNAAGESSFSDPVTVVTPALPSSGPDAASNLEAETVFRTAVHLTWTDNSDDEDGFRIFRGLSAGALEYITTVDPDETSYLDGNRDELTTFYYDVRAFNADGETPATDLADATTLSDLRGDWVVEGTFQVAYQPGCAIGPSQQETTASLSWTSAVAVRIDTGWGQLNGPFVSNQQLQLHGNLSVPGWSSVVLQGPTHPVVLNDGATMQSAPVPIIVPGGCVGTAAFWFGRPGLPDAPGDVVASAASSSSIRLSWVDRSSTEHGFRIYRGAAAGAVDELIATLGVGGQAFSDWGLSADTRYYYRVAAVNAAGERSSSVVYATTLEAPNEAPSTPALLNADPWSSSEIRLSIQHFATADSFSVYRGRSAGTIDERVAVIPHSLANSSFTDTNLEASTTYYYQVTASNAAGESGRSGVQSAKTLGAGPGPTPPSHFTGEAESTGSIRLTWRDNSADEQGFRIYRGTSPENLEREIGSHINSQEYLDTRLDPGTTYYYEIISWNASGLSAPATANATTWAAGPPAAPGNLGGQFASYTGLELHWDDSDTEQGYVISYSTNGVGGPYADLPDDIPRNTTSWLVEPLEPCTDYWFRVRAVNSYGGTESATLMAPVSSAAVAQIGSITFNNAFRPGTFDIACSIWTLALYDHNFDGEVQWAVDDGANPQRAFPRQSIQDSSPPGIPPPSTWHLEYGAGYDGNANTIVLLRFDTWQFEDRPNYLAIHLRIVNFQVYPVVIWGGDWSNYADMGIAMAGYDDLRFVSHGYRLPTATEPGFITGEMRGFISYVVPDNSASIQATLDPVVFHVPMYYDDQVP